MSPASTSVGEHNGIVLEQITSVAGSPSAPPVSIHYSLSTSAPAASENNLHSVRSDEAETNTPPTHTHKHTQTPISSQHYDSSSPQ
ncbi:hypothetical protein INR49_000703 [Caranx melampygus]|nr:hypothetical protein INR49_000703 [Caranx melampygus]